MSVKKHSTADFPNESIYFITFTLAGWKRVFINDEFEKLFVKWFTHMEVQYHNKIHAYVIMPSHFHALIYISEKSPHIIKVIQNAKRFLAYGIIKIIKENNDIRLLAYFASRVVKSSSHFKIFEDGFDCKIITSKSMFLQKFRYIHNNPCTLKENLCELPEDYKYSSARYYIDQPIDIDL